MSLRSGFFNSVNHDRTYDAEDVASMFDGAFSDGVFSNVVINGSLSGNQRFYVTPSGSSMGLHVGTGKAWFDHTYIINDEPLALSLEPAEGVLNRYDAIVIEINRGIHVRENTIKVIKGIPGNTPSKPTMIKSTLIKYYPIAYIYVKANAKSISQSNIQNVVGTSETPYAAGLIPMDQDLPFNFGIDNKGRYGYKQVGSSEVTPFTPFRFGIDGEGNYGYYKEGADTVTPFKTGSGSGGGTSGATIKKVATVSSNQTINLYSMSGFADIWENLTTSNFFVIIGSINVTKPRLTSEQSYYTISYDDIRGYQAVVNNQYNPDGIGEQNVPSVSIDELASSINISPTLTYDQNKGQLTVSGMAGSASHTTKVLRRVPQYQRNGNPDLRWQTRVDAQYSNSLTVSATIDIYVAY